MIAFRAAAARRSPRPRSRANKTPKRVPPETTGQPSDDARRLLSAGYWWALKWEWPRVDIRRVAGASRPHALLCVQCGSLHVKYRIMVMMILLCALWTIHYSDLAGADVPRRVLPYCM